MSRFQAQRKLGLFAPHDILMFSLIMLCLLEDFRTLSVHVIFGTEIDYFKFYVVTCGAILLALAWLIVLAYRVLVFVLDLHAEIGLMPEAAARIAAGYFEGRPVAPSTPHKPK